MAARRATASSSNDLQLSSTSSSRRNSTAHHHAPITSLEDCKKKQLPHGFADTILNLEILLDNEYVEIETIKELLELYMIGVEYYESIGDQKFIYFNKKMSTLMMKPNVIDAMSRDSNAQPPPQAQTKGEIIREAEIRQKEDLIRKTVVYSHQDNDEKAKSLLKTVEQDIKQNNRMIHDSLDTQKRAVFERLNNRRAKTLTKASSVPVIIEATNNHSDNEDATSQDGGNATTPRKIDFSSITNAINEEDDEEEVVKSNQRKVPNELIKKFKEQMKSSRPFEEDEIPKNKSRSNSQASTIRSKGLSLIRKIRDRKVSAAGKTTKSKVKSRSQERVSTNESISKFDLFEMKASLDALHKTMIEKASKNTETVVEAKKEEEEEPVTSSQ